MKYITLDHFSLGFWCQNTNMPPSLYCPASKRFQVNRCIYHGPVGTRMTDEQKELNNPVRETRPMPVSAYERVRNIKQSLVLDVLSLR